MKKIILSDVEAIVDPHPDLKGTAVKNLINADTVGAPRGMLSIAEFAPGGVHKLHRHGSSAQLSYLIAGVGEHLTEQGPVAIEAGEATFVPRNEWHGFRNTGLETAILLSIYSPAARMSDAGYETFSGAIDRSRPAQVRRKKLLELLDETFGDDSLQLGVSTAGVNRPAGADEFVYVLEGAGEHLSAEGAAALSAGEIAYLPVRAHRGFKHRPGARTTLLFGHFGAALPREVLP